MKGTVVPWDNPWKWKKDGLGNTLEYATCEPGPAFRPEPSLTMYMKHKGLSTTVEDPSLTVTLTALTDHQLNLNEDLDQKRIEADKIKRKHEKMHMIFQSQVAARANQLGIQPPLVTAAVLKRFQDCNYHGTDPINVADDILPLTFTPLGRLADTPKREQEEGANVVTYDTMIATEGSSLILKDSLALQCTKAYDVPLDWTEATTQLESYLAVLATILGATHTVVENYQRGLLWLVENQQMPLRRAITDELGERITPVIVVYYFQIRVRGWLEGQWESTSTIPSPGFGNETQNLSWLPTNVSNVSALRALCKLDPLQEGSKAKGGASPNNSHSNGPSSNNVHTRSTQTRLKNPNQDSRLGDKSHPIVKNVNTTCKMAKAIQSMSDNGKSPLL
eukprot:jgi/Psemu1/27531/gm1.27531_g